MESEQKNMEQATLGAGCFWCIEAIFKELIGVDTVISGYTGGHVKNPSYKEVTTGKTGHAEVAQITFDPAVISFSEILEVFWHVHDPTTLNRQGNDMGTQYRSAIFYHNETQREIARTSMKNIEKSGLWPNQLVTEITPLEVFYVAEDYHQNYFANNPNQPYCSMVINPKVQKFRKLFSNKLRDH